MEAIIVNGIVALVLVLFAVMALGPLLIEMRAPAKTPARIVHFPAAEPNGPADGQKAA
jgi:hypothetical protein